MLEYLVPDVNALVLDQPNDAGVVGTALAGLISNDLLLERMGARAREDVLENFRAETALGRWAALYEALGSGFGASSNTTTTRT